MSSFLIVLLIVCVLPTANQISLLGDNKSSELNWTLSQTELEAKQKKNHQLFTSLKTSVT